ncbi:2-amino-4-hydroxy-6-hydroxymethyldihydropteridine diphosphokinase [Lewinella marina]|uniref:2-amino-4-hydroxy-6-hydroxymethyldihydropteridine pyrophosphokinase n=1 Tax=Neolewinella marina TaxID=438751 RepID=A0A2G0CI29_9BACT|nr:2-amino-4-hydroxy-6-hydroxymethyldihydropteridine diphosphokinase [Neolewinella marina]NJB85232.1 2-amino-4-hydroxy-6-hydroxymethyldihydropteridine diphosphokinase [Neolewinella marina]PHK99635.1 2-amino-4-hydroxy-6-hydroxymethyldihydropteridine diphosphokinase [Neolewinella marina]
MAKLTLSIGSNLGNRDEHLKNAREALSRRLGLIHYASPVVETAPWGMTDQPAFLNQLLVVETNARLRGTSIRPELHRLLKETQQIEEELGRERDLHWGPRTVDIDLIFADDVIYEDERISLPHPWWRQRAFVTDLLPTDLRTAPRYFR